MTYAFQSMFLHPYAFKSVEKSHEKYDATLPPYKIGYPTRSTPPPPPPGEVNLGFIKTI